MEYNLNEKIRENLKSLGYNNLTEIQNKVIPIALSGKDIIGKSQTGTGKTAAFLIPIIESIKIGIRFQSIILAPTRELAIQIREEANKISSGIGITTFSVYGGEKIDFQINFLKSKRPEIIVGTPGRIIDHLKRGTLNLSNIKFFVLDEVDEMVGKGFVDDIRYIGNEVKSQSPNFQTLLFSATISEGTERILNEFLKKDRVFINSAKLSNDVKPLITQSFMFIDNKTSRIEALVDSIFFQNPNLAIIFASTKKLVDKISDELVNQGFPVEKIHSDLSQRQRTDVYTRLKIKKIKFLVATDIAARGIDIEGISHIYNYDFPQDPQFYIHRIGRTGRAGSKGESLIILRSWERNKIYQIERLTGNEIKEFHKPSEEQIKEIIKLRTLEKINDHIVNSSEIKIDSKVVERLTKYDSESLIKAIFSIFNIKRSEVKDIEEERKPRRGIFFSDRRGGYNKNNSRKPQRFNSFNKFKKPFN